MTQDWVLDVANLELKRSSGHRQFRLRVPNFRLGRGEAVAVVGPSGSGKSTLLDILATVLPPSNVTRFGLSDRSGSNFDVARLLRDRSSGEIDRMRARHIGYVLQTGGLLPYLSAGSNIALTGRMAGLIPREAREEAGKLAKKLGIEGLLNDLPSRLSVGERQRVAIARALCHRPGLVLADEPTAALDSVNGEKVIQIFLELATVSRSALIIASHDQALLDRFGLAKASYHLVSDGVNRVSASFEYGGATQ